ncbi:8761_t:CDS:2 [Dentiscutata erythropus]|uniref:8761_t:CDS:1 n=1 Tax=Dentiscutata erythropus TaxID=1348616 RepID=A0A9N9D132_9GLOM|nr:8761_t:CDS:2 [Dentiscutata erythropus]
MTFGHIFEYEDSKEKLSMVTELLLFLSLEIPAIPTKAKWWWVLAAKLQFDWIVISVLNGVVKGVLFRNYINSKEEKQLTGALQELHSYFWFEKAITNTIQKQHADFGYDKL